MAIHYAIIEKASGAIKARTDNWREATRIINRAGGSALYFWAYHTCGIPLEALRNDQSSRHF